MCESSCIWTFCVLICEFPYETFVEFFVLYYLHEVVL